MVIGAKPILSEGIRRTGDLLSNHNCATFNGDSDSVIEITGEYNVSR